MKNKTFKCDCGFYPSEHNVDCTCMTVNQKPIRLKEVDDEIDFIQTLYDFVDYEGFYEIMLEIKGIKFKLMKYK